jgi:hypothetical protein
MDKPLNKAIEEFYERNVLPLFDLPLGKIMWNGYSDLDYYTCTFYLSSDSTEYLLVNEAHHGENDHALESLLIGNAVAPHEKIERIHPKQGVRPYVPTSGSDLPYSTGDFSLFRIIK